MSATILIRRLTGSGPTKTDITSINTRVDLQDAHSTADTSNPVTVPASGTNYSYWCSTQLDCTVAPATLVNNLKWYNGMGSSSAFGTGVACNGGLASSYTQCTSAIVLNSSNYSGISPSPATDVSGYTSGSPLSVTGSTSTTGLFGSILVYQFAITSTAGPGPSNQETFDWTYDED